MKPSASASDSSGAALPVPAPRLEHLHYDTYLAIAEIYRERFGHGLVYADTEGNLLYGLPDCGKFPCRAECRECRKEAVETALRKGSPDLCVCQDRYVLWGIPVMHNQHVTGALIVVGAPLHDTSGATMTEALAEASQGLLELAVEFNVTNDDFLRQRRKFEVSPSATAEGPTLQSVVPLNRLKPELATLEASLVQGILHQAPHLARESLSRLRRFLDRHPIPQQAQTRGYALHLLTLAYQAAYEASDEFSTLLQAQYEGSARVLTATDAQATWENLERSLDFVLDLVARHPHEPTTQALDRALTFLERNFTRHQLSRADVARHARVSESHLSRLLKERTGRSFSEILSRLRVDRAAQLLLRTDLPLLTIALDVGFSDQSYFGRVFRRYYEMTPDQYRHR